MLLTFFLLLLYSLFLYFNFFIIIPSFFILTFLLLFCLSLFKILVYCFTPCSFSYLPFSIRESESGTGCAVRDIVLLFLFLVVSYKSYVEVFIFLRSGISVWDMSLLLLRLNWELSLIFSLSLYFFLSFRYSLLSAEAG